MANGDSGNSKRRELFMESLRITRTLTKELQNHFPNQECAFLAERLCDAGVIEITDEIIEKAKYLQNICSDFSVDRCAWLIASLSMSELCARYERFKEYCDGTKCEVAALELTEDKFNQYLNYFRLLGLSEEQQKKVLGTVIINGNIMKSIENAQAAINALEKFHITIEERNQFITDCGDILFNDYSRSIPENISSLIERYGKIKGFEELKKHPEMIKIL